MSAKEDISVFSFYDNFKFVSHTLEKNQPSSVIDDLFYSSFIYSFILQTSAPHIKGQAIIV